MEITEQEQRAIVFICLSAAFADGVKDDREREQIRKLADTLAPGHPIDLPSIYQDVLLKRRSVAEEAGELNGHEVRQLAYELAVGVCDADGARNQTESDFLANLHSALGLEHESAETFARQADQIAAAPLPVADTQAGELESMILNYSIANGALELLPQTLASIAILPLQIQMVYRIGKAYGYELDRGHIQDFAATLGIGFTGQYVEQMGRRLVGGLLGRIGGSLFGGLGDTATGAAFSFATTYALGHVAMQYYSAGRTIDVNRLREVFESLLQRGKGLQQKYSEEIRQKARNIDLTELTKMIPGV
jgi:uncharacterized protein (DUF697 family)/tellurite resistance protein